jgi:dUTPase
MVLTGQAIATGGLISTTPPHTLRIRDASCDLTVGTIIDPQGKTVSDYVMPPQGIVRVVSEETLKIDPDHVGYVHVKTSLCNRGILTLSIGIVDPGFTGPLGSTLINFGKTAFVIQSGEVFGRLTVHRIANPNPSPTPNVITPSDAKRYAQCYVLDYLSESFLDLAKTTEATAKKVFEEYKSVIVKYVPVFAVGLAVLVFLLNAANVWIPPLIKPNEYAQAIAESARLQKALESAAVTQAALRGEINGLRADVDSLKAAALRQSGIRDSLPAVDAPLKSKPGQR